MNIASPPWTWQLTIGVPKVSSCRQHISQSARAGLCGRRQDTLGVRTRRPNFARKISFAPMSSSSQFRGSLRVRPGDSTRLVYATRNGASTQRRGRKLANTGAKTLTRAGSSSPRRCRRDGGVSVWTHCSTQARLQARARALHSSGRGLVV